LAECLITVTCRLVTRATVEERMMQASKKKLVLEHLVVRAAGGRSLAPADLEDIIRYGAAALFSDNELRADKAPIADGATTVAGVWMFRNCQNTRMCPVACCPRLANGRVALLLQVATDSIIALHASTLRAVQAALAGRATRWRPR
jgi:hypothetical protein